MKHRLAMVGFGGMAGWHYDLIQRIDDLEVAGIWDIKEERRTYAEGKGIHVYKSEEDLMADPTVDIVLVATPNDVHKGVVIRALEAGKNAVSEKPVTLCSADLAEMRAAAEKTGKFFTVHQNRRWDEDFLTMKKIYDEGMLGDVFSIESRVHGSRGIPGDWRGRKAQGGGMMLDWGVHILDQMLQMVKEKITKVYAHMHHVTNYEVDDGFRMIVTFESGKQALLEVGTSNFINMPRWYMQGENGTALMEDFGSDATIVNITDWNNADAVPVRTAAGLTKTMAPRTKDTFSEQPLPQVQADIRDFYRNVMAAIEHKAEPVVKLEQVKRVMLLMEAVFRSAQMHQSVPFEEG